MRFVSRDARTTQNSFGIPTLRRIHRTVRIGVSAYRRIGVSAYRRIGVSACRRVGVSAPGTEKLFLHTIQARSVRGKDVIPKTGKDNRLKVLIRT
jgi:hypothetical protein